MNKLGIKSAMTEREAQALQKIATDKTVIEVGSLLGYSTIQIARVAKHVFAIDPHDGYPQYNPTPTLDEFLHNLERWNVAGLVTPIVDKAQKVLRHLKDADLAFIDCTGHYKDTMFCLENANTPVIACHDFDRGGCDVTRAVLDFIKTKKPIATGGRHLGDHYMKGNMSASIALFHALGREDFSKSENLHLQAFVGPADDDSGLRAGRCIQFTIGGNYACLNEGQIRAMISILQMRVNGNVSATADDLDLQVDPAGRIYT